MTLAKLKSSMFEQNQLWLTIVSNIYQYNKRCDTLTMWHLFFLKGCVPLRCSSRFMLYWNIGQGLCCIATMPNMWHINNVTIGIHQVLCHIVMVIKGSIALWHSLCVMSHCDIGQGLCHIVIMPNMWHINTVTFYFQEVSGCIVKYGHMVH